MFPAFPPILGRLGLEELHKFSRTVCWWMKGAPGRQERKKYVQLYEQGLFEEAALVLRHALTATPNDPGLMMRVASLSRFGLLPLEEALPLLRMIVSDGPPVLSRRALIYLVNILWERKGAGEAMKWFPRLIQEGETSPPILLRAAALANEEGYCREAFDLLARVGRRKPSALSSMGYLNLILTAADNAAIDLPQAGRAREVAARLSRFEGRFAQLIRQSAGNVAVVANGPSLEARGLGNIIDSHKVVIRFNNHAAAAESADHGQRTDIWFRPADFAHVPMRGAPPDTLLVLTGCNIRNRFSNGLQLLESYVHQDLGTELVPTALYGRMFAALDAAPSAGLVGLAWAQGEIGEKLSPRQVFGYSLGQNSSAVSHYYGKRHTGSWPSRHNWQAEQNFYDSLISEVIYP